MGAWEEHVVTGQKVQTRRDAKRARREAARRLGRPPREISVQEALCETTPLSVSPPVEAFAATLDSGSVPSFVPVLPEPGCVVAECFFNVMEKVEREGGSIRYGWIIWENPKVWLLGEFHAVWEGPDGELIDITPKADGERRILFQPDGHRVYEFAPVARVIQPLSGSPAVAAQAHLTLARERVEFTTFRGPARKCVPPIDLSRLSPEDTRELRRIEGQMMANMVPFLAAAAEAKGGRLAM